MATPRDPVCGMAVGDPSHAPSFMLDGVVYHFCSDFCRRAFASAPETYLPKGKPLTEANTAPPRIAYFTMEVAVDPAMPIYSGGLGVLAGDTLKSFADLRLPVVGVSILWKNGYFRQTLDSAGNQTESPEIWSPEQVLTRLPATVRLALEGQVLTIGAWRYTVASPTGGTVSLLLLDTNLPENTPADRELTAWLYGGDPRCRLLQEMVLGVGGVRMLRALGYGRVQQYHMNEGHAALLAVELLRETERGYGGTWDFEQVRQRCVFTTHTPVAAGHDRFPYHLADRLLGELCPTDSLRMLAGDDALNMPRLALNMSHFVNGVAKRHGEVSREMFAGYSIEAITNGVHSRTWTSPSFTRLFDHYIPEWASDPFCLRYAIGIPLDAIAQAHAEAKAALIEAVRQRTGVPMDASVLTLGFARRATPYKRADLLFSNLGWLADLARKVGGLQIVYAGKAHPNDGGGKELIRRVHTAARQLAGTVPVVYLPGYDMELAKLITGGVDLWLNTPQRPMEASGTSGMKAAHNGVPSLSVMDGWWIEGCIEGVTGWAIGPRATNGTMPSTEADAADLYGKLQDCILPLYYHDPAGWQEVMRGAIAFNASFFNTHRMVQQYAAHAYV